MFLFLVGYGEEHFPPVKLQDAGDVFKALHEDMTPSENLIAEIVPLAHSALKEINGFRAGAFFVVDQNVSVLAERLSRYCVEQSLNDVLQHPFDRHEINRKATLLSQVHSSA